jgi:hypothetical protein
LQHSLSVENHEVSRIVTEMGCIISKTSQGMVIIMHPSGRIDISKTGSVYTSWDEYGNIIDAQTPSQKFAHGPENIRSVMKVDPDTEIMTISR